VILGGHYTLGCHNKLSQQSELRAVGVDLFVENLSDLVPLLNHIAAAKAAQSDWREWLTEGRVLNQIASAQTAQSDWLAEVQGSAA
jgi:hypothetical protein